MTTEWGSTPKLIKGGRAVDDRGIVTYCNDFDMSAVKRWYMLENHREGFVRAWHRHIREAKWIMCVSGVAVEAAMEIDVRVNPRVVDIDPRLELAWATNRPDVAVIVNKPNHYILHPNGDILYVPPGYANGHKNLVQGTRLIHFSNLDHEDTEGDDVRFDASIHGWVWEEKWR